MKGAILGLIFGLVVGAGGGWLFTSTVLLKPVEEKLAMQETALKESEQKAEDLRGKYETFAKDSEAKLAADTEELSAKETRIKELKAHIKMLTQIQSENEILRTRNLELAEALKKYNEKYGELKEETQAEKPAPEDPDTAYRMQVGELMKNVTVVGGPLNDLAVKELELDENQVAGINELLKDEALRMRKRLLEWASGFIKDKTVEELEQLSDIKLGYALGSHVTEELEILQKLKPEDRRTIHVENHFIKFLPRDSKLARIVKVLYGERKKTYEGLAAYVGEEQERTLKEKYFTSGTFIFPGLGSFGIGKLTDEDFEQ